MEVKSYNIWNSKKLYLYAHTKLYFLFSFSFRVCCSSIATHLQQSNSLSLHCCPLSSFNFTHFFSFLLMEVKSYNIWNSKKLYLYAHTKLYFHHSNNWGWKHFTLIVVVLLSRLKKLHAAPNNTSCSCCFMMLMLPSIVGPPRLNGKSYSLLGLHKGNKNITKWLYNGVNDYLMPDYD
jgi:hypothetical protein